MAYLLRDVQHLAFKNIFLFASPLFDFGSSPSPISMRYLRRGGREEGGGKGANSYGHTKSLCPFQFEERGTNVILSVTKCSKIENTTKGKQYIMTQLMVLLIW